MFCRKICKPKRRIIDFFPLAKFIYGIAKKPDEKKNSKEDEHT